MVMLSSLLRYKLVDAGSRAQKVGDFAIDLSAEAEPPITFVLWHAPGQAWQRLPVADVLAWDEARRQIRVQSLEAGQAADPKWLERAVLLKRGLLDAIMLDLYNRRVAIANDLWLVRQDGQLRLKAVDVGLLAILRRVSGGLVRLVNQDALCDWQHMEFFRGNPRAASAGYDYHGLIQRLPPGEIAYLADFLPYLYAAEVLTFLPEAVAADVLEMMIPARQVQAFEELEPARAGRILALMRPDIIADLLSRLGADAARDALEHLPRKLSRQVLQLLRYPDHTVGGIMTNDLFSLPADLTAREALAKQTEALESAAYQNILQLIFVVDSPAGQKLRGVLTLRDLLIAPKTKRLAELMNPYLVTLHPLAPAPAAARRVIESGLTALPVVEEDGKLVGAVTVDTALALTVPKSGGREVFRLFT